MTKSGLCVVAARSAGCVPLFLPLRLFGENGQVPKTQSTVRPGPRLAADAFSGVPRWSSELLHVPEHQVEGGRSSDCSSCETDV
jgi:hypothetical protein